MLKSLFGDLGMEQASERFADTIAPEFAATAVLESVAQELNDRGQIVDRHLTELFVSGSASQAMREHYAAARAELDSRMRVITLYDPSRMWAGGVVRALSDAGGQPIERLHLRDEGSLVSLAMIERTTLHRRFEDTLKVYHADVRADRVDAELIPFALMERSQLTGVVVGPLSSASVDVMLKRLVEATQAPTWHCPAIVFMLPVGATAIANRIAALPWPAQLQVQTINEPLTSAPAVWNALLDQWGRMVVAAEAQRASAAAAAAAAAKPAPALPAATPRAPAPGAPKLRRVPDATRAAATLDELVRLEGMLGCALVDLASGSPVAVAGTTIDMELAAAGATEIMRTHRRTLAPMGQRGAPEVVDEICATANGRYHVIRSVAADPELFLLAVLDRQRATLAMVRLRLLNAQAHLG